VGEGGVFFSAAAAYLGKTTAKQHWVTVTDHRRPPDIHVTRHSAAAATSHAPTV